MKAVKHKILARTLAGLVSLGLFLTACGGNGNTTQGTGQEPGGMSQATLPSTLETEQTVRFWSIYPEGDPNYDWTMSVLDRFMQDNPKIKVEYTGISFWDYFTKITTAMTDRSGPDVFVQTIKDTNDRARGGVSLNLSAFLDEETNRDRFFSQDIVPMEYEGQLYGLPYALDDRILYYNIPLVDKLAETTDADWKGTVVGQKAGSTITGKPLDLVADGHVRAPITWDELLAYQELLTVQDQGRISQLGFDVTVGNMMFVNTVWNQGGDFFTTDGTPNLVGNDQVKKGFEIWYELTHTFPQARVNSFLGQAGENSTNLFWNQSIAMMIATNEIPWQNERLPEADRIQLGAAPVPYDGIEEQRFNFTGGFSLEMAGRLKDESADKQLASWLLMKYLTSTAIQKEVLLESSNLPGNKTAYEELAQEITDPAKLVVLNEMEHRKPYDYIYNAPNWFGEVQNAVTEMVSDRLTIDEAIESAQKAIERLQATY